MRWTDVLLIRAPADVVWRLTTQLADWPSFLPTVQRLERLDEGPLRVGSSARIKQPGQPAATWIVTRLDPGREFIWQAIRPWAPCSIRNAGIKKPAQGRLERKSPH